MSLRISEPIYNLPDPPSKLKHRRRNPLEIILGWFCNSHVCQVCKRKEPFITSGGWLQIDHPKYHNRDDCSVVCMECVNLNPKIFDWDYVGWTKSKVWEPDIEVISHET
jgi:hypothetical protein